MKKRTLSLLFSATAFALFLFSCSKNEEKEDSPKDPFEAIYGMWEPIGQGTFNPTTFQPIDTTQSLEGAPEYFEILASGIAKMHFDNGIEEIDWKDDVLTSHFVLFSTANIFKVSNDDAIFVADPLHNPEYNSETESFGVHFRKVRN